MIAIVSYMSILSMFLSCYGFNYFNRQVISRKIMITKAIQYDEKGYEIKPRDWFNGLSSDPGNSLADPRAVPNMCVEFAESIKLGTKPVTLTETLAFIDEHYEYISVGFKCGEIESQPGENKGSAKIFSFGLMTKMDETAVLRLFGEVYRNLDPKGSDHPNIRNFIKYGWPGVSFSNGLAIMSKLQAYDDTESAMRTQSVISSDASWDASSDSWIP